MRIKSQQRPSICDVQVKCLGRGVVTTTNVENWEILVDYHGEEIKGMSSEEYLEIPANQSKYLFQISHKHIVDASKEICDEHPNNRWLARLINHQSSKEANVKPVLVNIAQNKNVLVMVAKTEVAAFQELRFDYGDEEARRLFDPWVYLFFEVNRVLKNFSIKWLFDHTFHTILIALKIL